MTAFSADDGAPSLPPAEALVHVSEGARFDLPLSARVLGSIGMVFFYQMLYGTVIYWFSFANNKR